MKSPKTITFYIKRTGFLRCLTLRFRKLTEVEGRLNGKKIWNFVSLM